MNAQKKKSSGCGSAPKGDHESGLTPPILFVPPKVNNNDQPPTVDMSLQSKRTRPQREQLRTIQRRNNSQLMRLSPEMEHLS
jgi:hypothetical protein